MMGRCLALALIYVISGATIALVAYGVLSLTPDSTWVALPITAVVLLSVLIVIRGDY